MPGLDSALIFGSGAVALVAFGEVLRRRLRRPPVVVPYSAADAAHVAETGVPADALDLAAHPVTGDVTHRRRRTKVTGQQQPAAPARRVAAAPEAVRPVDDSAVDAVDLELQQMIQAETASTAVPDHVPGSNPGVELPASFSPASWSDKILDAHAAGNVDELFELAQRHRPLAWSAHLLALSLCDERGTADGNDPYAAHLEGAYNALDDLQVVGGQAEDPRLTQLRTQSVIGCRLDLYRSVVTVPSTPDGLRMAHAAHYLSGAATPTRHVLDTVSVDVRLQHRASPTPLTTLLSIDRARHLNEPVPPHPTRRADQWGLLFAAGSYFATSAAGGDTAGLRKSVLSRLDSTGVGDLVVDVDALATDVGGR